MNAPTKRHTILPQVSRPAVGSLARSRSSRASWLTLLGSVSLHAAVFAIAAHFVAGSGGDESQRAAPADGGDEMSLSVKIASPSPPSIRGTTSVIRKAMPAQQQRVFAAAHTGFALPPPEPQLDLPEPCPPEKKTVQSAELASSDAPPSKKIAGRTKKRGDRSTVKGSSGVGQGSGTASAPRPLSTRLPVYPYASKKRGEQGMVLVRVRVNESGHVESSALYRSSGHAELDDAAVACVWKWTFAPGQAGGKAVGSSAVVRVSFRLEG